MKKTPVEVAKAASIPSPAQAAGAAPRHRGWRDHGGWVCLMALSLLALIPQPALAAEIDGRALSGWWALPFAGMLLSIAILPLAVPQIWHHHFGKIAAGWALLLLVPFAMTQGAGLTVARSAVTIPS